MKTGADEKKKKIVIIGASILDVLVTPADASVFQTGSYPADQIKMSFGGDALNEAIVLSSLGKKVYLNTILGNDTEGDIIVRYCEQAGMDLSLAVRPDGLQTGINVVLVQKDGERNFLTSRNGSLRKLAPEHIPEVFPDDAGILCFASIFVFPELGAEEMAAIFRRAKEQGMTVCADMTKRKNGETAADLACALQYVDYLIPNEEEAYLITGAGTPEEAARILHHAGVKHVIIKCGKKGCFVSGDVSQHEDGYYVPAVEGVVCVDTTGAGDSFSAGFLYGLSEGWDLRKCAEHGNRCGAKAVARVGAVSWCLEQG